MAAAPKHMASAQAQKSKLGDLDPIIRALQDLRASAARSGDSEVEDATDALWRILQRRAAVIAFATGKKTKSNNVCVRFLLGRCDREEGCSFSHDEKTGILPLCRKFSSTLRVCPQRCRFAHDISRIPPDEVARLRAEQVLAREEEERRLAAEEVRRQERMAEEEVRRQERMAELRQQFGWTPLHSCAFYGDAQGFLKYLAKGEDINAKTTATYTIEWSEHDPVDRCSDKQVALFPPGTSVEEVARSTRKYLTVSCAPIMYMADTSQGAEPRARVCKVINDYRQRNAKNAP